MEWNHTFIFLGSSTWPGLPQFEDSQAMELTHERLTAYIKSIPDFDSENELLDLFGSDRSVISVDESISKFLKERRGKYKKLVVFYIGHGHLSADGEMRLCLKSTKKSRIDLTTYRIKDLSKSIYENASDVSTLVVLDCCWSAAAYAGFQLQGGAEFDCRPGLKESILAPAEISSPGLALLCASSSSRPAISPPNGSNEPARFGEALETVLLTGMDNEGKGLTARQLQLGSRTHIRDRGDPTVPDPEVHFPRGQGTGIDETSFFPNLRSLQELSRLGQYSLRRQLESAKKRTEELARENTVLRDELDRRSRENTDSSGQISVKEGFFSATFLNEVIGMSTRHLDIIVGRARLLNYSTLPAIRRLCSKGVLVRIFSLSENASLVTLTDALQTVAPHPPENAGAYKRELKELNASFRTEVSSWTPEEQSNVAFYTYAGVPRTTFVRFDETIYFGFLTLFKETHVDTWKRPYLVVSTSSPIGIALMLHAKKLAEKDTTNLLVGNHNLKVDSASPLEGPRET